MDVTPLVGRDHPLSLLRARIVKASRHQGGLVFVTGEGGIGKTALVTTAAQTARESGMLLLSGWCADGQTAPAYWPWIQVLRDLRGTVTRQQWTAILEDDGCALASLLGEDPSVPAPREPFALHDAVTSALVTATRQRPVMVVLDDLHWADPGSLRLLQFAVRHSWLEPLLIVGTYRNVEVETVRHPLRALMTSLAAKATVITLTGLAPDEVGRLIVDSTGRSAEENLVTRIHQWTGGNPFFVEQAARLWHSSGSISSTPTEVSDAVQQRLSLLANPVRELLIAAALLGRRFGRQALAAASGLPAGETDQLLEQAVATRLVVRVAGEDFSFVHDLVREALYRSLNAAERRRRHAGVVWGLDQPSSADRVPSAELARHAFLAGEDLDGRYVVDLQLAAARDAGAWYAAEEAVGHYRRALERIPAPERRLRAIVELDLARELQSIGEQSEAWTLFRRVADAARDLADADLLARAALVTRGVNARDGERQTFTAELLHEAYTGLVGSAPTVGHDEDRIVAQLAIHIAEVARRDDDDDSLAFSLWTRHDAIWGLGSADERYQLVDELITLARRRGDWALEQFAASMRWVASLERGDPVYLNEYRSFVASAERGTLPRFALASYVDRSIVNMHTGHFAEAEDFLDRALAPSSGAEDLQFPYVGEHLRWSLRLLQGHLDELDALHRGLERQGHPYPRLLRAITRLHQGDAGPARDYLADAAGDEQWQSPLIAPLRVRLLAHAAALTADPALCAEARSALEPFQGQWLVSLYGGDVSGPVDLWLGLVALAEQDGDTAVAVLTRAHRDAERLQARPWSVLARAHLAAALLCRAMPGDAVSAQVLLDEAGAEAERTCMAVASWPVAGMAPDAPVPAGGAQLQRTGEFRRSGSIWRLGFAGHTVQVTNAKGLVDLHALLSMPGVDVPAVRLLNPHGGEVAAAARSLGADPVLDETAKAQYKRRLKQIDDDAAQALDRDDHARVTALDREREALVTELRQAAGLGGRTRRLGDDGERARKAVTARIHDVLRKLDSRHPALAAHLRQSVSTGATCRYLPENDIAWLL